MSFAIYKPKKDFPDKKGNVVQFDISKDRSTVFVTFADQIKPFTGTAGEQIYDYENKIIFALNNRDAASLLASLRAIWSFRGAWTDSLKEVQLVHDSGKGSDKLEGVQTNLYLSWPDEKFDKFKLRVSRKLPDGTIRNLNTWLDQGEALQVELLLDGFLRNIVCSSK